MEVIKTVKGYDIKRFKGNYGRAVFIGAVKENVGGIAGILFATEVDGRDEADIIDEISDKLPGENKKVKKVKNTKKLGHGSDM